MLARVWFGGGARHVAVVGLAILLHACVFSPFSVLLLLHAFLPALAGGGSGCVLASSSACWCAACVRLRVVLLSLA